MIKLIAVMAVIVGVFLLGTTQSCVDTPKPPELNGISRLNLLNGKDLIDNSVPEQKLADSVQIKLNALQTGYLSVVQDATSVPAVLGVYDTGLSINVQISGSTAVISIANTSDTPITFSLYRHSVYDGVSEGQSSNATSLTPGSTISVDGTVYTASNDIATIEIGLGDSWYRAHVWVSDGGVRTRIIITKVI
jgi:hypothetical protein